MGENPQHNQHIQEVANAMDNAFSEQGIQMTFAFSEVKALIEGLDKRVTTLEQKATLPVTVEADVVPTKSSMKKLRDMIAGFFG